MIAAGLLALALGSTSAWPLGDTEVTATDCSLAAGRDAIGNTVTCNYGLSPEQVKELTEAAVRGATGPLTDTVVALSKQLGATEDATKTLLRIVGEQNVPLERLSETLTQVANDYKRLQAQVAALNPDNPTARDLVRRAKAEIAAGHFTKAHQLLQEATQAQIAVAQQARQLREQAQAAEEAQLIGAAASTAVEGDLALTERDYWQAAQRFGEAAALVPPGREELRVEYCERQANAFYRQGGEKGDNAALGQAIAGYRDLLEERTRERVPLMWATTQMNVGNALQGLGARESGTERLEQAVAAYQAALEERIRERVPLDWATTQNNLGSALASLSEREGGTEKLEQAVAAYQAALEERARERVPLDWATTQNNLGNALASLGERESSTERLEQAVVAYRAALEEWNRERVPLDWARTQNNLGNALQGLGERLRREDLLTEALQGVRQAQAVYVDAGLRQYDEYFATRIAALEAAISAMGKD